MPSWSVPRVFRSRQAKRQFKREYALGLAAAAVMLPAIAAMVTGSLYIAKLSWPGVLNENPTRECLYGTAFSLGVWLLLGIACRRFGRVDRAQPSSYGELLEAFARVQPRVANVGAPAAGDREGLIALAEARAQCEFVDAELHSDRADPRWLLASGYVDLWKRVHRIEEALIELEPESDLLREAFIDDSRLQGTRIADCDQLLRRIGAAVTTISPTAEAYLSDDAKRGKAAHSGHASPPESVSGEARNALRQVRLSINEYRDSRREGLVRARNNLLATVVFTGITGYAILVIALLSKATPQEIAASAAFYLVGAVVGLFRQLGRASDGDTVLQDDFGYSLAKLVHTPLFSGLAAIGGVVLTSIFPALIPTGATMGLSHKVLDLATIFNIQTNQGAFVIAAVFGLSPNLLINRLQHQVEQFKSDLKSSESGERRGPS